jgi:hypothetical protein
MLAKRGCVRGIGVFGMFAALSCVCVTENLLAQTVPVAPSFPAAIPAAPQPTFLQQVGKCCTNAKVDLCNSGLGKLVSGAIKPISMMTGGVIPECCASSQSAAAAAAAKNTGSVPPSMGAAAKIEANLQQVKARVAAVQFLATIDCHWFPEAEAALVASLRADPAECVRLEAARALARGCCCTKVTVEALNICVSGSEKDGNPSENSLRVKAVAWEALYGCMSKGKMYGSPSHIDPWKGRPEVPAPESLPEGNSGTAQQTAFIAEEETPTVKLTTYYQELAHRNPQTIIADARSLLVDRATQPARKTNTGSTISRKRTGGSLAELWEQAGE